MAMIPSGLLKITGPNLLAPVISVNALVIKQLASYLDHAPVGNWLGGDVRSWVDYRKARRTRIGLGSTPVPAKRQQDQVIRIHL